MAGSIRRINSDIIPKGGPYTQIVVHGGAAYLSGIVGTAKEGNMDFSSQWDAIVERATSLLSSVGADLRKDTIKAGVFLSSQEQFQELNRKFAETFGPEAPARTTIVCKFVSDAVLVEMDLIVAVS